jgi:hypothetical protein
VFDHSAYVWCHDGGQTAASRLVHLGPPTTSHASDVRRRTLADHRECPPAPLAVRRFAWPTCPPQCKRGEAVGVRRRSDHWPPLKGMVLSGSTPAPAGGRQPVPGPTEVACVRLLPGPVGTRGRPGCCQEEPEARFRRSPRLASSRPGQRRTSPSARDLGPQKVRKTSNLCPFRSRSSDDEFAAQRPFPSMTMIVKRLRISCTSSATELLASAVQVRESTSRAQRLERSLGTADDGAEGHARSAGRPSTR